MTDDDNLEWYLNVIEKELAKTHSPASNIMNVMTHIKRLVELRKGEHE